MKRNFYRWLQMKFPSRKHSNTRNGNSPRKEEFKNQLHIQRDEWFFVTPYGIGDIYLILSLMPEFRRIHRARKISIGIVQEKHRDVFALFPFTVDRIELISEKDLPLCEGGNFEPGHPVIIHPGHIYPISMVSLIGYKKINLLDIYKILLNLPMDADPVLPVKPEHSIQDRALKKFREYGLENGNTVLIAPDAYSYSRPLSDVDFWKQLVKSLGSQTFKVAMMSNRSELMNIEGVHRVEFPLIEAIPFSECCGYFIGNRSGFCDLISSSKAFKIVLFSKEIWHSGHLIDSTSQLGMGLAHDNILEFEFDVKTPENDISRITAIFSKLNNERNLL